MTARLTLKGGPELRRAFDALADDVPDAFDKAVAPVVERIVGDVRSTMPRVSGTAASGVGADGAKITFGSVPYQPWLDFGGKAGNVTRPWVPGGRYIYPSIVRHEADLKDAAGDAVLDAARHNSFDVSR